MRDAGYSETVQNSPKKVTETKGWQMLLDEHLPDDLLSKVHRDGLEATKPIYKNNNDTDKQVYKVFVNHELNYKLIKAEKQDFILKLKAEMSSNLFKETFFKSFNVNIDIL